LRIEIRAIARIRPGPERSLVDTYIERANHHGRSTGLGPVSEREFDTRTLSGAAAETRALADGIASGPVIALDERGKQMDSRAFSQMLGQERDQGARDMCFLIGGADGFDHDALPAGVRLMSLGRMVWPHKLVRVMLAEQIYRASALLSGAPYHRD
jgi:23S rRNA (pseudouridine1915-N3)-methyltransferase